jgi:low affinity Fe/Cu permease
MSWGDRIAEKVSTIFCSFPGFVGACLIVVVWAICGPYFHFSDTWQLVINTGTTIVTFLMAFLIGANGVRQAARAEREAIEDFHTNLKAKEEIEELQKAFVRMDNKLDALLSTHGIAPSGQVLD